MTTNYIFGEGYAAHKDESTQVWFLNMCDGKDDLVALSLLTLAILKK